MLENETIDRRLQDMVSRSDPSDSLWPENCAGSRKAIVIFVGPSPGGKKEEHRREIKLNHVKPLWDKPYDDLLGWSTGFKKSFRPIVEAIFGRHSGYGIAPPRIGEVKVRISGKETRARHHNNIMAFRATRKDNDFLVIKSLQHPARIYDAEYASRVGISVKSVAEQMWKNSAVTLNL